MSDIIGIQEAVPSEATRAAPLWRMRLAAYVELSKPRIAAMVLLATAVGFYLARAGGLDLAGALLMFHTLLGTALVGAGANAVNQYLEVEHDRVMVRTRSRPLPSGRLQGGEVLVFGMACAVGGSLYLVVMVNALAGFLAALTFGLYAFVYTPMKRWTTLCVVVGAIPGAMPPLIGWAAASGTVAQEAWLIFGIIFFWQLPHVAAIAWQYREDYARAGFYFLPVIDKEGTRTRLHVMTHSVSVIAASLLPALYGITGAVYAVGAMVLGLAFLICGIVFVARRTSETARFHVLASVTYLPMLLTLMMADKV